jgi:glycosyltransferase involved in cell wall biosynthesis
MKKIAILAAFPLHHLKGFGKAFQPKGHYATWLPQIAEAWDGQKEVEIHWIVMSELVKERRDVCEWGQMFHVLPTSQSGRSSTLFREDRKAIHAVLDEIRADLVHGWGTEDVYGLAAVLSGRPNIVSMQGILSAILLKSRMHPREYFQGLLELYCLRKAQVITTESEWGRAVVRMRRGNKPVEVVEYGVQKIFFSTQWKPAAENNLIIFVGSIRPGKGIQDLVEAFRDPKLSSSELVVIGGGEGVWSENLQKGASSNIRWLGRKTAEETAEYMSKAWCLLLPTRADTSPNVVKEARVIGLPVITTRNGGQASYVRDGEDGYFMECGDVNGLVGRLETVLGSFSKAKEMGDHGKKTFRELFIAKRTGDGFMKMYHSTGHGLDQVCLKDANRR